MQNKALKSITALLICLIMLASSIPVSAAEQSGEPTPAQTEPVPAQTESALANAEPAVAQPIMTEPSDEPSPDVTSSLQDTPADGEANTQPSDPSADSSVPGDSPADTSTDVFGDAAGTLPEEQGTAIPTFAVQWNTLPMYVGNAEVFQWSIVLDNGGYYIYAVTNMYESAQFVVSYDEGGEELLRFEASTQPTVLDSLWNPIPGAYVQSYVDNNTRYSEIYIPQSFFKDIMFTITCGRSVNSLDITDRFGMPVLLDIINEVSTLEEPVGGASDDAAFIDEANSALASANCSGGNWGVTYQNGCYNLYIKGDQWSCAAGFNVVNGYNYSWVSANPVNNNPITINGVSTPLTKIVQSGTTYYALYSIPESVLPSGYGIQCNQGVVSSDDIKANGSAAPIEPEDPTIAAIKSKLGSENWAIEPGSDGTYHLYIIDNPADIPAVTVTDKATGEALSPALTPAAAAEKDGLRYSEYTLSDLPDWFDISYNGQTKTFGTNPDKAFIDNVIANAADGWKAVLNSDGSCNIYVVSDSAPAAGDFTFENRVSGDSILIDESSAQTVYDPETGKHYTKLAVANPSEWFDVTYNGASQTIGENPDQATIDEISAKLGQDGWKVEKGTDGLYHVYVKDGVDDEVNITVTDKTQGNAISTDFTTVKQVTDENGNRYSEYTASIDSDVWKWFDISYNGNEPVTFGKDPNAAYNGIVIDGEFADWDAVPRYPFYDNPEHNGQVPYTSMVWDGDKVYIYLESKLDDDPNQPANNFWVFANSGYNGVYEIRTDLNKRLIFQICPTDSPNHCYIAGVDGAEIKITDNPHGPNYCEISIPTSELPEYLNTISFGAYLYDTSVPNVGNMNDPQAGMDKSFNGIVYDGYYADWKYYPHSIIYYDGQGIHVNESNAIDGEQALWSNGETIFGHVVTEHVDHLAEGGGEFTEAVTIRVNDNLDFHPRMVRVDPDGTIHWNDSQVKNLPDGEYEYYLFDANAWSNCTNISQFTDPTVAEYVKGTQQIYGKIHITVGASKDECEYYIDSEALAKKFGMDPDDIKTISSQFGRIGQQWATTAGTSTGAFLGILLCLATVSGTYFCKKKKSMGIK